MQWMCSTRFYTCLGSSVSAHICSLSAKSYANPIDRLYNTFISYLVTLLAPLVVLVVKILDSCQHAICRSGLYVTRHTFGKLTLGTITSFKALGALFLSLVGSPPGWYW